MEGTRKGLTVGCGVIIVVCACAGLILLIMSATGGM